MLGLDGKIAIVTGATRPRGMGRAIAVELAKAGASVVISGRRSPPRAPRDSPGWYGLDTVAEEIRALGGRVLPTYVDVTDPAQIRGMVADTLREYGRIDILVNNAAADKGPDRVPVVDLDEEAWERVLRVNLSGTFLCSKYVARAMIEGGGGGRIVNVASVHGRRGDFHRAAYCASKFGVIGFTQALAHELGPGGITVNAVCPGVIATDRTADWGSLEAKVWGVTLKEARAQWLRSIPLRRRGSSEEVAAVVLFLASDLARYVSGQAIHVCGGKVMM